jgi:hypothetical protein
VEWGMIIIIATATQSINNPTTTNRTAASAPANHIYLYNTIYLYLSCLSVHLIHTKKQNEERILAIYIKETIWSK